MGTDLNNVLKTQKLSEDQIVFLTYQILRGLKFLHTSNIIHRVFNSNHISYLISLKLKITFSGFKTGKFDS